MPHHIKPGLLAGLMGVILLAGCADMAYYGHILHGQMSLLDKRKPIADIVASPETDPTLKARLELVQQARIFAVKALGLPDNGSYTLYADLGRPYAVWNVFAAPEFSLTPHEWCHLVVGCVAYRGYYDESLARAEAAHLHEQGLDVNVGGVAAYSTLGWFDDPVLNTMLSWRDDQLLDTLFHELAHQKLFLKGDTAFNESFATFVGEEGLRTFRASRGEAPPDAQMQQRRDQFLNLVLDTQQRLAELYALQMEQEPMRSAKSDEFERLRKRYAQLREQWAGYRGYDSWFEGELNNAKLVPIGLYQKWVPAFAALFAQSDKDWPKFYEEARKIGKLASTEREARLKSLEAPLPLPSP